MLNNVPTTCNELDDDGQGKITTRDRCAFAQSIAGRVRSLRVEDEVKEEVKIYCGAVDSHIIIITRGSSYTANKGAV